MPLFFGRRPRRLASNEPREFGRNVGCLAFEKKDADHANSDPRWAKSHTRSGLQFSESYRGPLGFWLKPKNSGARCNHDFIRQSNGPGIGAHDANWIGACPFAHAESLGDITTRAG